MKKIITVSLIALLFIPITGLSQSEVQRVRIDFETPLGYTRQLLLGFTPDNAATDDFDYGYDGACLDDFPDDFNYLINDERYIIQGVGAFDDTKIYPVGAFLTNSGTIKIALNSTENFDQQISVFIYNAHNNSFHLLNDGIYEESVESGIQLDKYYVAFSNANSPDNNLSIQENELNTISMRFDKSSHQLVLKSDNVGKIKAVHLSNLMGQSENLIITYELEDRLYIQLPKYHRGLTLLRLTTNKGVLYKKLII